MRKFIPTIIALAVIASLALAGDYFTSITSQYPPDIVTGVNAALDAIEDRIDGTTAVDGTFLGLTVNDSAAVATNLVVGGTATVTGAVTMASTLGVTGNITGSGAIDVDSVTTDAGAGVDTQAAGTLMVGAATANKVEIADTGIETEIQGTLDAQEAATFASTVGVTGNLTVGSDKLIVTAASGNTVVGGTLGVAGAVTADDSVTIATNLIVGGTSTFTGAVTHVAAPVLTATTAATDVAATATNAPALVSADSPAWITVTISGESYVIPAYQLDD